MNRHNSIQKHYFFVFLSGILYGTVLFGGKILSGYGLSAYELSFFPFIIPVILLLPLVLLKKEYHLKSRDIPVYLFYGIVCAATCLCQFGAIMLGVSVAMVVMLLYSQPIWTIIFARVFLKEKINLRDIVACIVVLLGVIILVNPFGARINSWAGIIVALLGGVSLAAWIVIGSYASKKMIPPISIIFGQNLFQIAFLLLIYPIALILFKNLDIISITFNHGLPAFMGIIIFGLVSATLAPIFYFIGVQKVSTVHSSVILLLEPVSATLLSIIFLNESITINIILGGLFILAANFIVVFSTGNSPA